MWNVEVSEPRAQVSAGQGTWVKMWLCAFLPWLRLISDQDTEVNSECKCFLQAMQRVAGLEGGKCGPHVVLPWWVKFSYCGAQGTMTPDSAAVKQVKGIPVSHRASISPVVLDSTTLQKYCREPWMVWLSGLSTGLTTKGSRGGFPVRAHAWVVGQVPSRGHIKGNRTLMFLSLSFSLHSPLSKNK